MKLDFRAILTLMEIEIMKFTVIAGCVEGIDTVYLPVVLTDIEADRTSQTIGSFFENPPLLGDNVVTDVKVDTLDSLAVYPFDDIKDAFRAMINQIMDCQIFDSLEHDHYWSKYASYCVNKTGIFWTSTAHGFIAHLIDVQLLDENCNIVTPVNIDYFDHEEFKEDVEFALSKIDEVHPSRKDEALDALLELQAQY